MKCSISDCNNKACSKGWCGMHYSRWYRWGDTSVKKIVTGEQRTKSPLHQLYFSMIQRCTNPNTTSYKHYGHKGINVCDRWLGMHGFSNFKSDMGERPTGYSLDRIDNSKGYSPDNCRWASATVQAINQGLKRNNTSGVKGVSWHNNTKKWCVDIHIDGKPTRLGYFSDKNEAIRVRKGAEEKYFKPLLEKVN